MYIRYNRKNNSYEVAKRIGYTSSCKKCKPSKKHKIGGNISRDTADTKDKLPEKGKCNDKFAAPIIHGDSMPLFESITKNIVCLDNTPQTPANPIDTLSATSRDYTKPLFGEGVVIEGIVKQQNVCSDLTQLAARIISLVYHKMYDITKQEATNGEQHVYENSEKVIDEATEKIDIIVKTVFIKAALEAAMDGALDALKDTFPGVYDTAYNTALSKGEEELQANPQIDYDTLFQSMKSAAGTSTNKAEDFLIDLAVNKAFKELIGEDHLPIYEVIRETVDKAWNKIINEYNLKSGNLNIDLETLSRLVKYDIRDINWPWKGKKYKGEPDLPVWVLLPVFPGSASGLTLGVGHVFIVLFTWLNETVLLDARQYKYRI